MKSLTLICTLVIALSLHSLMPLEPPASTSPYRCCECPRLCKFVISFTHRFHQRTFKVPTSNCGSTFVPQPRPCDF
ncbi:hypothetical protein B0H19DRAFT_1185863 [Mycena capillaripes]|nr:hypothetical protein B0H19DRAFT_1185863 [Mycena capillaripes]